MSRYFTATLLAAVVAGSAFNVSAADHHGSIERAFRMPRATVPPPPKPRSTVATAAKSNARACRAGGIDPGRFVPM